MLSSFTTPTVAFASILTPSPAITAFINPTSDPFCPPYTGFRFENPLSPVSFHSVQIQFHVEPQDRSSPRKPGNLYTTAFGYPLKLKVTFLHGLYPHDLMYSLI
jgi:hypothetical protein